MASEALASGCCVVGWAPCPLRSLAQHGSLLGPAWLAPWPSMARCFARALQAYLLPPALLPLWG